MRKQSRSSRGGPLRSRAVAAMLASALALGPAGCHFMPKYERPAAPVPNQFAGADAAGGTGAQAGASAADLGWRDVLADPRLAAIVKLALEHNRDLRIATLNVELVRAQYRIQRSAQYPTVAGTGGAELSGRNGDVAGSYRVGVAIAAFEVDLFGRVRSLNKAALEEYFATAEAQRAAHLALIAEVAAQYLNERAADEQRVLAEQTLKLVESTVEMTQRLVEAGQRSDLDASTAAAQLAAARAALAQAKRLRAQAENALVLVVGAPLPADLPPAPPLEASALLASIPVGLPSELLQRRPDILSAEHTLKSANANIGAARAAFFPSITLTGFGGVASTALTGLFKGPAAVWSFAPQISIPLFTGGKNQANLDAARIRKRIEIARYEQSIQVAFREVSDALTARAAFDEQLEAQIARAAAEQKRFELSEMRYRNGVESYLTVISAQQALFAAQQQLIELRRARLGNIVGLYKSLGGGWNEQTQTQTQTGARAPAPARAAAPAAAHASAQPKPRSP